MAVQVVVAAVTATPAPGAGTGSTAVDLYRSPAAHLAWTKVLTAPPSTDPSSPSRDSAGPTRLAVHGSTGWLLAHAVAYHTSDGVHWARSGFTCDPQHSSWGAAGLALGPDPARVVITCTGYPGPLGTEKEVAVSTDAGAHFTTAAPVDAGLNADAAVPGAGTIVLATSFHASWLQATFEAGRTWTLVLTSDSGGQAWTDLGFTTPLQGVVIAGIATNPASSSGEPGSQLWMTHDGAHTWAR